MPILNKWKIAKRNKSDRVKDVIGRPLWHHKAVTNLPISIDLTAT